MKNKQTKKQILKLKKQLAEDFDIDRVNTLENQIKDAEEKLNSFTDQNKAAKIEVDYQAKALNDYDKVQTSDSRIDQIESQIRETKKDIRNISGVISQFEKQEKEQHI